jgi:hypothetical protein
VRLPISVTLANDLDSPSKNIEDADLQGLTNGQLLEKIVDMCADRGLLVRHTNNRFTFKTMMCH